LTKHSFRFSVFDYNFLYFLLLKKEKKNTKAVVLLQELAKILGKVGAIEKCVEDRAAMDEATRDAQALWLATVALNLALQNEEAGSVSLKEVSVQG